MTLEEILGKLWGILETWGPLAIGLFAVFFLIVFSFIVFVFIRVIKGMKQMDREHIERFNRNRWK